MAAAKATAIKDIVYVGGGDAKDESHQYLVCKYNLGKDEWTVLPPAPLRAFGVGQLNGKLVIVGGLKAEEVVVARDVYVFEEDVQQWVKSIPPMPKELFVPVVVSLNSSLVVYGMPDTTSPAEVIVYNGQSSQWHSATPLPLNIYSTCSSAVVVNDTYYIAVGGEGVAKQLYRPSSAAVFSLPLSILLDPNAPQDSSIWQRMPDTPCHMSHLAATGGCLLALGGLCNACDMKNGDEIAANLSTAVHAYCPAASSWIRIGDLPNLRVWHTVTVSAQGLFTAGGWTPHEKLTRDDKVFRGVISKISQP